jgi:UPF0755 protein
LCLLAIAYYVFREVHSIPRDFPQHARLTIEEGATLGVVSDSLAQFHIIDSPLWFKLFVTIRSGERSIRAGEYLFDTKLDMLGVIKKLTHGDYGFALVKVTIPEGFSIRQIADVLAHKLESFSTEKFVQLAREKEGYLFPETYTFATNADPQTVVNKMTQIFEQKIEPLKNEIASSKHSLKEITTMASLLEEEAKTPESRRIVSGILWNRIAISMPLQVDAAFLYINGKTTYELTKQDLAINSPYNTYRNKGLPPTPISNPGFDSLDAAVHPTQSPYLYYLSERDGTMHYAKTYAEHLRNKARYIPN